jgi:hypothetical protein
VFGTFGEKEDSGQKDLAEEVHENANVDAIDAYFRKFLEIERHKMRVEGSWRHSDAPKA